MNKRRVALTFDAEHPGRPLCPPGNHDAILDILTQAAIRASFFLQGRWATAYPDAARRIARSGYLVGNHSDYHARMPLLTDAGIEADVRGAEERIRRVTGTDPRPWFRCPFGETGDDGRVIPALRSLGYRNVGWDVDGMDWDESRSVTDLEAAVVQGVRDHGDGAIVLLHTWPAPARGALPGIIERLGREGFSFVAVDEVIDGR